MGGGASRLVEKDILIHQMTLLLEKPTIVLQIARNLLNIYI